MGVIFYEGGWISSWADFATAFPITRASSTDDIFAWVSLSHLMHSSLRIGERVIRARREGHEEGSRHETSILLI